MKAAWQERLLSFPQSSAEHGTTFHTNYSWRHKETEKEKNSTVNESPELSIFELLKGYITQTYRLSN